MISETRIQEFVHRFYAKVRQAPLIGPVFNATVKDWAHHLDKLTDFWSSVMLTTGRYKGNPMMAHLRLKTVQPAHFERWLALFSETARETFSPEAVSALTAHAKSISRSLQLGVFYRKRPSTLPALPAVERISAIPAKTTVPSKHESIREQEEPHATPCSFARAAF